MHPPSGSGEPAATACATTWIRRPRPAVGDGARWCGFARRNSPGRAAPAHQRVRPRRQVGESRRGHERRRRAPAQGLHQGSCVRRARCRRPAGAGASGGHRRRHHRLLGRLSPGRPRLDGHGGAGAPQRLRRHHLARRRADAPHAPDPRTDRSGKLQPRLLQRPEGAYRGRRGLLRERIALAGADAGAHGGARLRAQHGAPSRPAGGAAGPKRHRPRGAAAGDGRPGGRRAVPRRRHRQPRRGHLRDRHGGLRPRRTHRRRRPRHRLSPGGRPGDRRADRQRPRGMRGGSDRRWPVVARRGPHGRHTRTAAGGPARLGADDGRRRRHARPADSPRPGRPLLRAALPRRPGDRRFCAGRQGAAYVVHSARLRLRRVRARQGAHGPAAGRRPLPHPGRSGRRPGALPQRARELHAGRGLPDGRDGRSRGTVGGRRAQLAGHHLRPGRRQIPGRMDRRRRADGGRCRLRRAPLRGGAGERALPAGARAGEPRPAVHHALAVPAAGIGARSASRAALRPPRRGGRLLR